MTSGIIFENVKKAAILCEKLTETQGNIALYRPGDDRAALSISFSCGGDLGKVSCYEVEPVRVYKRLREQEASLVAELRSLGVICDTFPANKRETECMAASADAGKELIKDVERLSAVFTSEQEFHRAIKGKTGDIVGSKYFEGVSDDLQFRVALVRRSDVVKLIQKYSGEVSGVKE